MTTRAVARPLLAAVLSAAVAAGLPSANATAEAPASAPVAAPVDGAPGIGDPYWPLDGNGGIDTTAAPVNISIPEIASDTSGNPLTSYNIGSDGVITGVYSDGTKTPLFQVALANFANPGGLDKVGDTAFRASTNSGTPVVGSAGTGRLGKLMGGAIEMSNVDLSEEFTSLIVAQRGFQANSRVITASDELLQDLVNLKR